MSDLTTLANLKAWLGPNIGTASDVLLQRLISAASTFVESWLNRALLSASYADTYNGQDTSRLLLANTPVTNVAAVTIDGQAIPQRAPLGVGYGFGFVFDDISVMVAGYRFCRGFQNVAISYTAGYATVPLDIEQAVIEIIAQKFRERDRPGLKSQSIEGQTVVFNVGDIPASALIVLQQYKGVVPV